jgi:hypothetical protein
VLEEDFPNLAVAGYEITSCAADYPNCVGYALGDMEHFWDPDGAALRLPPYRWILELPLDWKLETVTAIFSHDPYRYEPCGLDANLEAGYEKVAIYVDDRDNEVSHVARQLMNGKWTSKLGPDEDIDHDTLEALEADTLNFPNAFPNAYGKIALVMKRRTTGPA